jgi:hypothetical protein
VSELRGEEIREPALMTAMATGAAVAEDER